MTSTALYDESDHAPLESAVQWDANEAREGVRWIAAQVAAALDDDGLFAAHPRDTATYGIAGRPTTLYPGAAGTWLGLGWLASRGLADLPETGGELWQRLEAHHQAAPDLGPDVPGILVGAQGLMLLRWLVERDDETAARLRTSLAATAAAPGATWDLFHGVAGAMHVALHGVEHDDDAAPWRELWRQLADALLASWRRDEALGCRVWTQRFGELDVSLCGAAHGVAGNVHALLRGARLLDEATRAEVERDAAAAVVGLAVRSEDGRQANWPVMARASEDAPPAPWRLRWSDGAPGVLLSARGLSDGAHPELAGVLEAGATLIADAGPRPGDASLANGTGGAALALLAQHRRTGQARWLEAARRFAMSGLVEVRRAVEWRGESVHPGLWTGDLGVAMVLEMVAEPDVAAILPGLDPIPDDALSPFAP